MKELSIEEKAKRYDKALTKARNIVNSINVGLIEKDSFEAVFPELKVKEYNDEEIRKAIISGMKSLQEKGKYTCFANIPMDDVFAWLEKQDQKDSQVKLPTFTFYDVLALQCCMETVKKVQEDKDLYNELLLLHNKVHDAYTITKR